MNTLRALEAKRLILNKLLLFNMLKESRSRLIRRPPGMDWNGYW
ncbi:hypothetical protein CCP4SC76_2100011 [Gammaproteobacteria bacterium]